MKRALALLMIVVVMLTFASCKWGRDGGSISSLNYEEGSWNENVYSSSFLNTAIIVADDWEAATEEEIAAEKQHIIEDSMASSEASKEEIERGIIYELKLTNDESFAYMDIVLKDMDIIYSMAYSEEDFMAVYRKNMQEINMENMYISSMNDAKWVTLGGNEYYMMEMEYSYNKSFSAYQRLYLKKIGTYMCSLTMSVVDKAEFTEVEGMFSEYIKK